MFTAWIVCLTRGDPSRPLILADVNYVVLSVLLLWTGEVAHMHQRINALIKLLELD